MSKETPIINILTSKLPFKIANQIYNEYQNRLKESIYLIENYSTYKSLDGSIKTLELFLALSIFYKRIITNLDGVVKFHNTVENIGRIDTIQIGSYNLTSEEKKKLLAVVINYNKLLERFSIPSSTMEYYETKEFLKKILKYKSIIENEDISKRSRENGFEEDNTDLPF